jgi:hypothetical protein
MQIKPPLTNLQLEVLKVFFRQVPDEDLRAIKALLSNYFAQKETTLANEVWEQEGFTEEKMNEWRQAHLRTEYKTRNNDNAQS